MGAKQTTRGMTIVHHDRRELAAEAMARRIRALAKGGYRFAGPELAGDSPSTPSTSQGGAALGVLVLAGVGLLFLASRRRRARA